VRFGAPFFYGYFWGGYFRGHLFIESAIPDNSFGVFRIGKLCLPANRPETRNMKMKFRHCIGWLPGLLTITLFGADARADEQRAYALTNANIFNGVDDRIMTGRTVLVRDGIIENIIGSGADVPAAYSVIDCEDKYLLPGLIDVHTHLETLEQAGRA